MKYNHKFVKIILMLIVAFSFSFLGSGIVQAAEPYENPTLTLTDFKVMPGETFTTTLCVDKDANIIDFQLQLNYNTEFLTLVSAEENVGVGGNLVFNSDKEGIIAVTYSRTKNNTKEIPVLDLTFKADDNLGVGVYNCLTVASGGETKADRLISGVLTEVALNTDFQKLSIYETGDVDLNNKLQITDATTVRLHLAYTEDNPTLATPLSSFQLKVADTMVDNEVTITDASYIQMKLVNLKVAYGNRLNVTFYDGDGNQCALKSVSFGGNLNRLPTVPARTGFLGGKWSASKDEYVKPTLTGIKEDSSLYAFYDGEYESEAIAYYKELLTNKYYTGDLPTGLSGDLNLDNILKHQNGYTANITWSSSNNYILNSTTGKFNKPTYPTKLNLVAQIVSYNANDSIEGKCSIAFTYQVPGKFDIPTKAEIAQCLKNYFTNDPDPNVQGDESYLVNYDLKLPQKLSNERIPTATEGKTYEVRLSWAYIKDGVEVPLSEIKRSTVSKDMDLVATITFNGEPLENDGKVYLDAVHVTAIDEFEIKNYIVKQVAANMGSTLSTGVQLWDNDTVYHSKLNWQSNNVEMASIANNVLTVSTATLNSALLPITAEVSYTADDKVKTFDLEYTVAVTTDNELLEPGTNITAELYDALKNELSDELDFHGNITTGVLRDYRFVNLNLSKYPNVTSLKGLSYCKNIRSLNISGLQITEGMNEICTLSKLEAFVARNCSLDNLTDGGKAVLQNSVGLKLLDLSDNRFANLNSVFGEGVRYSKLSEVYLNNNQLTDISALSSAPAMMYLSMAGNGLGSEDLSKIANFSYLRYLSLAYNNIEDISALTNLKYVKELRLHNNQIKDVRALKKMIYMQSLYLGHNQIRTGIDFLDNMTELRVLYLNDNGIDDIGSLVSLENLQAINVSNNPELNNLSVLSRYAGTLEEIYAENDALTSFSFIDGMAKLRILMLANNAPGEAAFSDLLTSQLSVMKEMQVLTLSGKPLYDLKFLANMPNIVRLDVANCKLGAFSGEESNIAVIANHYKTLAILDMSHNDMRGSETEISKLKNLSNLTILYADNICDGFDADTITKEMINLKYISLEKNGITNLNWLTRFRGLEYVDLADNAITAVDLGTQIGSRNSSTLKYLYLDTNEQCSFTNSYVKLDKNVLKELSLAGVSVSSMSRLPYMNDLEYLNLSNTGLTEFNGHDDPDLYEVYSIERFKNLKTLDVSGVQADITPLQKLPKLTTLYGVSVPQDTIFHQTDIHVMQKLYNTGVKEFLYAYNDPYLPLATREGVEILNLLKDFSCSITVAADGDISDNNPVLPTKINDFDITWSVSNSTNYEVRDGQIHVRDYTGIDDEALTLRAQITVYPDQAPVTREFTINTKILRANAGTRNLYYNADATGFGDAMQRGDVFKYDVSLQKGVTAGFANPVTPVENEIRYSYESKLDNGTVTPYMNVFSEANKHSYTIVETAPLKSLTTIKIEVGHNIGSGFIIDDVITIPFSVVERTYMLTYNANGGVVVDGNEIPITQQRKVEETKIFDDITVNKPGYSFVGWYTDEACEQPYWLPSEALPLMPSNDISLYAKWVAYSYTINFNANEGTIDTTSMEALCDKAIGALPTPVRDYYTFSGWFTEKEGGKKVTAETINYTADNITLYAHWTLKPVSDWVLSSAMPKEAKAINEKWSYDEKSYVETTEKNLEGYTQYGNYWQKTDSNSFYYANFPGSSQYSTSDTHYINYKKAAYTSYENETTKRVASTGRSGYILYHWAFYHTYGEGDFFIGSYYNENVASGRYANIWESFVSDQGGVQCSAYPECYRFNGRSIYSYWWLRLDRNQCTYTDYVKYFKYYKIQTKESDTKVATGENISNVQKWVQYREK